MASFRPSFVVASLLALAVSLPTHASAAEPAAAPTAAAKSEGASPTAKGADMDEVKRVYGEGKAKYATKDYDGAIADWTRALGMLPETDENLEVRNDLVYNVATAQEKAYEIDKDVTRLRKAKALLEDFLANRFGACYAGGAFALDHAPEALRAA